MKMGILDTGPTGGKIPPQPEEEDRLLTPSQYGHVVQGYTARELETQLESVGLTPAARGAYSRFKGLLEGRDLLAQWYEYESKAQAAALRRWCEENEIEVRG